MYRLCILFVLFFNAYFHMWVEFGIEFVIDCCSSVYVLRHLDSQAPSRCFLFLSIFSRSHSLSLSHTFSIEREKRHRALFLLIAYRITCKSMPTCKIRFSICSRRPNNVQYAEESLSIFCLAQNAITRISEESQQVNLSCSTLQHPWYEHISTFYELNKCIFCVCLYIIIVQWYDNNSRSEFMKIQWFARGQLASPDNGLHLYFSTVEEVL